MNIFNKIFFIENEQLFKKIRILGLNFNILKKRALIEQLDILNKSMLPFDPE